MPFASQKQRGLFHAAEDNPALRKRLGMSKEEVGKMLDKDKPGKLPTYAPGVDGIVVAISKRKKPGMESSEGGPSKEEINAMGKEVAQGLIEAIHDKDAGRTWEMLCIAHNMLMDLHGDAADVAEGKADEYSEE